MYRQNNSGLQHQQQRGAPSSGYGVYSQQQGYHQNMHHSSSNTVGGQQPQQTTTSSIMTANERTVLWAEQNYYPDSGINSGVASRAATSVISGVSGGGGSGVVADEYCNQPPQYAAGFAQDHVVESYNNTANLVGYNNPAVPSLFICNNVVYPEVPGNEIMELPSGMQYELNHQSSTADNVQYFDEQLNPMILSVDFYRFDPELASKALFELIRLLGDEDIYVARQAADMVHCLSKREAEFLLLPIGQSLIQAIIELMNERQDQEILKDLVGTLYRISSFKEGRQSLLEFGAIPALLRSLESPTAAIMYYAITTLHNMISHQPNAKEPVRQNQGVRKLLDLLRNNLKEDVRFLAIVVDCIYNLVLQNQDAKIVIWKNGGANLLVGILRDNNYEKLLWTIARLLQALSVCPKNKQAIVACGGLQALGKYLSHASHRLLRTVLLALRNLSDAVLQEENVDDLLSSLLQLVGSSDFSVVSYCLCILSNITCSNVRNKTYVCENGGIDILMRTLEIMLLTTVEISPLNRTEIIDATLCTLRHITMRHPGAETARNSVVLYCVQQDQRSDNVGAVGGGGLYLISKFVQQSSGMPLNLIKTALVLLKNFCDTDINLSGFYKYGVAHSVCEYLNQAWQFVKVAQQQHSNSTPIVDGVNCTDFVVALCDTLQLLVKHHAARSLIRNMQFESVFLELIFCNHSGIQRVSTGVLSELVNLDQYFAQFLEQQNVDVQSRLNELKNSTNETIAINASNIIRAISRKDDLRYQPFGAAVSLLRDESDQYFVASQANGFLEMPPAPLQDEPFEIFYSANCNPIQNFDQIHMNSPAVPALPYESMDTGGGGHVTPQSYADIGTNQQRFPLQHVIARDWPDSLSS